MEKAPYQMKVVPLLTLLVLSLAASVDAATPAVPSNVRVGSLPAEVFVRWDPSPGADHYWIARGGLDRRWVPLPPVTAPRFRDPDFRTPTPGYYQIAAVSADGGYSDVVEFFVGAPPPAFPSLTEVSARPLSDTSFAVAWSSVDLTVDGTLEVGTSLDQMVTVPASPRSGTRTVVSRLEFVADGLQPNTPYYYRLTSVNGNNAGFSYWGTFTTRPFTPPPPTLVSLNSFSPSLVTDEDVPVDFTLVATNSDGTLLPAFVSSAPFGLLWGIAPDYTYVSNPETSGTDYLDCVYTDGVQFYPARVWVAVGFVKDPPIALDQSLSFAEDQGRKFFVQAFGWDFNPGELDCQLVDGPTNGVLTKVPFERMSLQYLPNTNFTGIDHFTFRCFDASSTGNIATVRISVDPINDPPVINNQSVTIPRGVATAIHVSAMDPDGDAMLFNLISGPQSGTLSSLSTPNQSGDYLYVPTIPTNNADSFVVRVTDGVESRSATVSITINPPYFSPVANNQSVTTESNLAVVVTLSATAAAGQSVTYTIRTSPANGALSGTAPNLVYTPRVGFVGADSFTFQPKDAYSFGSVGTVSIAVVPQSPPLAPSDLVAGLGASTVNLSWTDSSQNETGFEIERAVDKGQPKLLAVVGANTSVYVDGTVSKNKSYSYRIRAINAAGKSPYSNTATVKTPK